MVHRLTSICNIKHLDDPKKYPHICHTGVGYSLELNKVNSIYESGRRMKLSYGILARGTPAFKQCQIFAPKYFKSIAGEFNPSARWLVKRLSKNGKKKA